MSNIQLVRLASVKTLERRTSSGVPSMESTSRNGENRRSSYIPEERITTSSRDGDHDQSVRIEVYAHGILGQEAVLVASLSNSVLLVIRIGGEGQVGGFGGGLHSWLLEWPVAGKIRGLCVSPDLQCVLCVTEDLEGVYILSVNNLGAEEGPAKTRVNPESGEKGTTAAGGNNQAGFEGDAANGLRSSTPSIAGVAGAPTGAAARPKRRVAADMAFPSLLHLASRGQRRRATGGAVAHTPAEPVFIASLARAGGIRGKGEQQSARGARRYSAGSYGRSSHGGSGKGRRLSSRDIPVYECLWWAAQNGDHLAVIGGLDGEVHFLDLERLEAWVVEPPPPSMPRGQVCAMSITSGVDARESPFSSKAREGSVSTKSTSSGVEESIPADRLHLNLSRHLVTVLETGAVFVVLLEHRRPGEGSANTEATTTKDSGGGTTGEGTDKSGEEGDNNDGGSGEEQQPFEYTRLRAGQANHAEFSSSWLDVGRGGGGGGGGGIGVRLIPSTSTHGRSLVSGPLRLLQMSIISRAWGNKCSVKIVRLALTPDAGAADREGQQEKGRERVRAKHQPIRTETVKTFVLPVDHASPEEHAFAAIGSEWAVLASPPAGGVPARVSIVPLDWSGRASSLPPVRVFYLPLGEQVGGVSLFPGGDASESHRASSSKTQGKGRREASWGIVWSEFCIYRVDLGDKDDARPGAVDAGQAPSKLLTPPPMLQPQFSPSRHHQRAQALGGNPASIAVRRPPASSVRRARELQYEGRLAEAVQVAMDALDESRASTVNTRPGKSESAGSEEHTGGGVTTRMVREDLANSLLEWLVTLHVRRLNGSSTQETPKGSEGGGDTLHGGTSSSSRCRPVNQVGVKTGEVRHLRASARHGTTRGTKQAILKTISSTSPASGERPKPDVEEGSPALKPAPAAPSQLERYLLSSLDYDPLQAATLLHANGEADLAVLAGAFRGGPALQGVLRVLSESEWPPRLSPRAVGAVCSCGDGSAARNTIRAGGGVLYAALEPRLRCSLLLSNKSILFGDGNGAPTGGGEESPTASTEHRASGDGAVAGIQSHLAPILSALQETDLGTLIGRLAQWCKEDATLDRQRSLKDVAPGLGDESTRGGRGSPSVPGLEAIELLLAALCELGSREPLCEDEVGRRAAWLFSGCLLDLGRRGRSLWSVRGQDAAADSETFLTPMETVVREISDEAHTPMGLVAKPRGEQRLEWSEMTTLLCDVLADEGIVGNGGDNVEGICRLSTAARRSLRRVLPIMQGWHDPVRTVIRAREARCWAAVAIELELSHKSREAASALLHGVVTLIQGSRASAPGEATLILSGKGPRNQRPYRLSQAEALQANSGENRKLIDTATTAVLQIMDTYVFQRSVYEGNHKKSSAADAEAPAPPSTPPTSSPRRNTPACDVILSRASVLAESLCVWGHFDLPVEALEEALRPRLDDRDDVRVLTAVLFPQLSPNGVSGETGSYSTEIPSFPAGSSRREVGTPPPSGNIRSGPMGPTPSQMAAMNELSLRPRFLLSLTRASVSMSAASAAAARVGRTSGVDGAATGSSNRWLPDSFAKTDSAHSPPFTSPDVSARPSTLSLLALLMEHRAGGGTRSSSLRLGSHPPVTAASESSGGPMPMAGGVGAARRAGWPPRAMGHAGGWPGAAQSSSSMENVEMVYFSCGHGYTRDHLLKKVVPASIARVRHSTSSLRQTQQLLAMEYEERTSEAACPECAAQELQRLVADLRPSSGASGGRVGESGTRAIPAPPPLPPSPDRVRPHGRTRVR